MEKNAMNDFLWWRDGIIYQIYPRSFCDSNDDGLGDLPGIIARLDYLANLGIDAIWLSPFYPTPDCDFGYDISDHTAVDPRFGSLEDFDMLVSEAHRRGIRIVLDMVMNHTSDQHPWFLESRSSRTNPKRDWYIWKTPSPSGPTHFQGKWGKRWVPNNWQACFGDKAWTYDSQTGEYYLHLFTSRQPDVNWRNPAVRKAQLDVFRFWLERGVDGFRLDVFNAFFKDEQLRDNPSKPGLRAFDRQEHIYDMDQPEMMPLLNELRAILDSYPEHYAVGETYLATPEKTISYCGPDKLHAAFSFDFTSYDLELSRRRMQKDSLSVSLSALDIYFPWNPTWITDRIMRRESAFNPAGIWLTTVMGNHDLPRAASRYCRGEDDRMAKIVMTLLLTLRGTPFMYYGEEIGMRNIPIRRREIMDPPGKKYWPIYKGRDVCRSPMQWDDTPNAGFTKGNPWLKVHPNYPKRNVAAQQAEPDSLLNFTRKLIALRKESPALIRGDFTPLETGSSQVMAYLRTHEGKNILVALNFSNRKIRAEGFAPVLQEHPWELLLSTARQSLPFTEMGLDLEPYEVCMLKA